MDCSFVSSIFYRKKDIMQYLHLNWIVFLKGKAWKLIHSTNKIVVSHYLGDIGDHGCSVIERPLIITRFHSSLSCDILFAYMFKSNQENGNISWPFMKERKILLRQKLNWQLAFSQTDKDLLRKVVSLSTRVQHPHSNIGSDPNFICNSIFDF